MIQGFSIQLEFYPDLLMKYNYEERQSSLALVEAEEFPHFSTAHSPVSFLSKTLETRVNLHARAERSPECLVSMQG